MHGVDPGSSPGSSTFNRSEYDLNRYHTRRRLCIAELGGVCVDCGTDENLQFDHIDAATKKYEISLILLHGDAKLFAELRKCVLRCKPCHDRKTIEFGETGGGHNKIQNPQHGSAIMYHTYGCRCLDCKYARSLNRNGQLGYHDVAKAPDGYTGRRGRK